MPGKPQDIKGQKFGRLTALRMTDKRDGKCVIWEFGCECGQVVELAGSRVARGKVLSCGCLKKELSSNDLTGQRFGRLVASSPTNERISRCVVWVFKCDCGETVKRSGRSVSRGKIRSCGCLMEEEYANKAVDLTAQRFGRLVALAPTEKRKRKGIIWQFECDCGNVIERLGFAVSRGGIRSCGCYKAAVSRAKIALILPLAHAANRTHGHSRSVDGGPTGTYKSWRAMIQRCTHSDHPAYHRYGGRGITVCARWTDSFEAFLEDMGDRPTGKQLDRIYNDRGYEPGNCRWITGRENCNNRVDNRHLTFCGRTLTVAEWSRETGISSAAILVRLSLGWSEEEAVSIRPDPNNAYFRGTKLSKAGWTETRGTSCPLYAGSVYGMRRRYTARKRKWCEWP